MPGINRPLNFSIFDRARSYLLAGTLLGAGSGCLDSEQIAMLPPAQATPVPIETVEVNNLSTLDDGCLYGSVSQMITRESHLGATIVAMQALCPPTYRAEGTCNALFRYPNSVESQIANPTMNGVCYDPQESVYQDLEPCQKGALVCAALAPGDSPVTTPVNSPDGIQTTQTDIVEGPDRVELEIDMRCCPSQ